MAEVTQFGDGGAGTSVWAASPGPHTLHSMQAAPLWGLAGFIAQLSITSTEHTHSVKDTAP